MKRIKGAIQLFLREGLQIWQMFIAYLPGQAGFALRYRYWKKRLRYLGEKVRIDVGVYFQNPDYISIDDNSWIDRGVIILAGPDKSNRDRKYINNPKFPLERGAVHIGKNVHIAQYSSISGIGGVFISDECNIAAYAKIYSFTHHYRSDYEPTRQDIVFGPMVSYEKQYMIEGPIFLGKNVGLAMNSVLLPGVSIEKNSFVAISSVVRGSFVENSLIAGNPARMVKTRFQESADSQ